MKTSVILPSYNPSKKILNVVDELIKIGFDDIIIVDDGGSSDTLPIFEELKKISQCTVLHHEINKGKGRALKTGFTYFLENRNGYCGVITADDDGQHTPEDILRCAKLMEEKNKAIFGVRDFKAAGIPWKSRFGNRTTSLVFKFCCGITLSDTQTGLRALPCSYLNTIIGIKGERFEYETNMLLEMKQSSLEFQEEKISTIYENGNKSTHFNPIKDSIKIYAVIAKFLISSLSCSLIDIGIFTFINLLPFTLISERERIAIAYIIARIISSLVNFIANHKAVFRSENNISIAIIKYYLLCVVQLFLSYMLVLGFSSLFSLQQSIWQTVIKMFVDTFLFFISFVLQREWVFKNK